MRVRVSYNVQDIVQFSEEAAMEYFDTIDPDKIREVIKRSWEENLLDCVAEATGPESLTVWVNE